MSVWSRRASAEPATGGGAQNLLSSSQAGPPARPSQYASTEEKPIKFRRGEGGGVGKGGPCWSPASCSRCSPVRQRAHTLTTGRPARPSNRHQPKRPHTVILSAPI